MTALPSYFTEVLFPEDPERERLVEQSPYSILEHPFRVLVHDSEFNLLAIGTVELGEAGRPCSQAQDYADGWPGHAMAVVFNRCSHTIEAVLVKPLSDQHAATHHPLR